MSTKTTYMTRELKDKVDALVIEGKNKHEIVETLKAEGAPDGLKVSHVTNYLKRLLKDSPKEKTASSKTNA